MTRNNLKELVKRGSSTARRGFRNERGVVKKFNSWKEDSDAQAWLKIMKYDLDEIEKVRARRITGYKTDVQVEIKIYFKDGTAVENISIKLVSNPQGFNQIDKRWVNKYQELWAMPGSVVKSLKFFTGEIRPPQPSLRDKRRIFLNELSPKDQEEIIRFFTKNKILIVADLFKGRDRLPASWMLIYQKDVKVWTLLPINVVMSFYGEGPVEITKQGSLKIGRIGMQRKGGDNGRDSANMLQFKINPCAIVNDPENGQG